MGHLFADFDNDGFKDLFVANGVSRDVLDKDFKHELEKQLQGGYYEGNIDDLMKMIPSTPITNKYFKNMGDLTFSDRSFESGFTQPGFSNGAAYADLDLDGDLDIVINNLNSVASVYQNNTHRDSTNHYLRIKLLGDGKNPFALGAKVTVKSGELVQYQELTLTRGFKSSVESRLHFGLGRHEQVDEVFVEWPGGRQSTLYDVSANQVLEVSKKESKNALPDSWARENDPLFTDITKLSGANFYHKENIYDDYQKEILLPHKTSQFGPKLAVGDIDGNGLYDFFVGGTGGQAGILYLQSDYSLFCEAPGPWEEDRKFEDIGALFFDADNDGDPDLYVVSGGNEFPEDSPLLQDRLYLNEGNGDFRRAVDALPEMLTSGGCVAAADYDNDGDMDFFVGGRLVPGKYPFPPRKAISFKTTVGNSATLRLKPLPAW